MNSSSTGKFLVTPEQTIRAQFSKLKSLESVSIDDMERLSGAPPMTCERELDKLVDERKAYHIDGHYGPMYYACLQACEDGCFMSCGCTLQRTDDGAVLFHQCADHEAVNKEEL